MIRVLSFTYYFLAMTLSQRHRECIEVQMGFTCIIVESMAPKDLLFSFWFSSPHVKKIILLSNVKRKQ